MFLRMGQGFIQGQVLGPGADGQSGLTQVGRQGLGDDIVPRRKDYGLLDDIFEFPDIAGPTVPEADLQRGLGDAFDFPSVYLVELRNKMARPRGRYRLRRSRRGGIFKETTLMR